jgi:tRNA1Val (adenine37-N6)-methyltransferase
MRNTFFKFKEFTVHQDKCAMKVTTDACIFGATIELPQNAKVLDVGAGTGLLSLMLAQRFSDATINALEIDESAAEQCLSNVQASKFAHQITVQQGDFFETTFKEKYDVIICNPPFFENQLASNDAAKNVAWHSSKFNLCEFVKDANKILPLNGEIWMLIPTQRIGSLEKCLKDLHLQVAELISIYNSVSYDSHVSIVKIMPQLTPLEKKQLFIKEMDGHTYTSKFNLLLKDFYLQF